MSRDDDGSSILDSGPDKGINIGGTPIDIALIADNAFLLFNDSVIDITFLQGVSGCLADIAAPQY